MAASAASFSENEKNSLEQFGYSIIQLCIELMMPAKLCYDSKAAIAYLISKFNVMTKQIGVTVKLLR